MATYDLSQLLARAECYHILSQLFGKPESEIPNGKRIFNKLLKNANELKPKELQLVRKLRSTVRNISAREIESEYARLFQGDTALAFPFSSFYSSKKEGHSDEQDIIHEYYEKASFKNDTTLADDHIVVELKFIHHLIQESTKAFRVDNFETVSDFSCLHCHFIRDHMIPWVSGFTQLILNNSESPYYLQLAILTRTVLVNCKEQEQEVDFS